MREIKSIVIIFLSLLIVSCSTIGDKLLNPYASGFQCPLTDKGECIKLKDAYEKSLKQDMSYKEINISKEGEKPVQGRETAYQEALHKKLTVLLTEPATPLLVSPKVVRVLFLPYKAGDNTLMMPRYVYFFFDEPQWMLENYLMEGVE